jgi:putative Mn2+ efflux pump MntP
MALLSALLLALGLAMDATAVAVVRGLAVGRLRPTHPVGPRDALRIAILFGGFQSGMSAIGWVIGDRAGPLVERWDHWIAFGLLALLGGKMIFEALRGGDAGGEVAAGADPFGLAPLLPLALATSIDALAAGVTLELVGPPPWLTLALIAGITAALSVAGLHVGRRAGALLGRRVELAGGLILIGLGVKVLVEHLSA